MSTDPNPSQDPPGSTPGGPAASGSGPAGPAGSGQQPSEEELRAAYEAELARITSTDMIAAGRRLAAEHRQLPADADRPPPVPRRGELPRRRARPRAGTRRDRRRARAARDPRAARAQRGRARLRDALSQSADGLCARSAGGRGRVRRAPQSRSRAAGRPRPPTARPAPPVAPPAPPAARFRADARAGTGPRRPGPARSRSGRVERQAVGARPLSGRRERACGQAPAPAGVRRAHSRAGRNRLARHCAARRGRLPARLHRVVASPSARSVKCARDRSSRGTPIRPRRIFS